MFFIYYGLSLSCCCHLPLLIHKLVGKRLQLLHVLNFSPVKTENLKCYWDKSQEGEITSNLSKKKIIVTLLVDM